MAESTGTRPFPVLALLVLAGAIFVSVTGEFLPTGLLPDMARDLEVSVPQAGLLVSVFAGTVVLATAPLAALTRTVSRKQLVVTVLVINAVATVLAAVAPNYEVLIGARILAGLAHGLFWAVIGSYSAHLVAAPQLARAIAITGAGGSAAFVLGVPVGTALGHGFGWRLAFGIIAVTMLVLAALVLWLLPPVDHRAHLEEAGARTPLRQDASLGPVLVVCGAIAVVVVGQNVLYTYIAPFITDLAGFSSDSVGPILFLYGGAGAIGLVLAGVLGNRRPILGIAASAAVVIVCILALGAAPTVAPLVVTAIVVWGVAFGALPPLLQTRNMTVASLRIRDLASAGMTTAFNVGIGGGALVGAGLTDAVGLGVLAWVAAAVMASGVLFLLVLSTHGRLGDASKTGLGKGSDPSVIL
jgi:DHA1 family inner membrane transport protein